jgi:Domain of unknown function (DUF5658)
MVPVSRRRPPAGNHKKQRATGFAVFCSRAGQTVWRPRTLGGVSAPVDEGPAQSRTPPPPFGDRRVNKTDRRALTWRTLLASGFSPRRRTGRRAGDHDLPIDFHEPRLLIPVVTMLLLSTADAFLTVWLMTVGAEEANPLLAFVLSEHPRLFAIVKMVLTGGGVVLLVALARARLFKLVRVSFFLYGLVAAYFALVAYEAWLVSVIL